MPSHAKAHKIFKITFVGLLTLVFISRVSSMILRNPSSLGPPLEIKFSQEEDPLKRLTLTLNQHAREERTRIHNMICHPLPPNDSHKGILSATHLSEEEQKKINDWIADVDEKSIGPTFLLHFSHVFQSYGDIAHPFTAVYTFNVRETLFKEGICLEEAFGRITWHINQWSKEARQILHPSNIPFKSVKDVNLYFLMQSLSDLIWFGLQRSSEEGNQLPLHDISQTLIKLWWNDIDPISKYGPMDMSLRTTRNDPPVASSGESIPPTSADQHAFQDITYNKPRETPSGKKVSATIPIDLVESSRETRVGDEGQSSRGTRETSIERLLENDWEEELEFASRFLQPSHWDTGPWSAEEHLLSANNYNHLHNHNCHDINHFPQEGVSHNGGLTIHHDHHILSSNASPNPSSYILPVPQSYNPLGSPLYSSTYHNDPHILEHTTSWEQPPPNPEEHQHSEPDFIEQVEKFLYGN
ncbi:hypothetical protein PCANC_03896 [Puccinia coronata f. sp. avenae]|uniref:Uncharacterized protein n=1 Tax=Puccinia coronata f. sp. avenae TaxID=200324 RepID=A0A2N5W1F3_9BASI|nr:hypothetical protein PCANC_03896 [Puccinia coronata f. sp. avenae]